MSLRSVTPAKHGRIRGWHRCLLLAVLACMVALYSQQSTHLHHSAKYGLEYPHSQVEKPAILDSIAADPGSTLIFTVTYCVVTPDPSVCPTRSPLRLKPQSRAPPSLHS